MGGTTTGLPEKIGRDPHRKRQGLVRRSWVTMKNMKDKVGKYRQERKIKKQTKKKVVEEEATRRAKEELKQREKEAEIEQKATVSGVEEINRDYRPKLDVEIKTAIIRSQRRPPRTDPAQMDFADIIRDHRFLEAIRKGSLEIQTPEGREVKVEIKTPAERADSRYAEEEMVERRRKLAMRLEKWGGLDDKTFTTHELDIIYATAVGQAGLWNDSTWPEDKPSPPKAFFKFLDNVAHKKQAEIQRGEFIGHVIKDLCTSPTTISGHDVRIDSFLMDSRLGEEYIKNESEKAFTTATDMFGMFAKDILTTPTSEFVESNGSKLEVPGVGYEKITDEMISAKRKEMMEARGKADEAKMRKAQKTVENAINAETAAKNRYQEIAEKV